MIEKITLNEFYNQLDSFINPTEKKEIYVVHEITEVNYGNENDCDVEWCKEHNIPVYNIQRAAGCCVSAKGNISIADVRPVDGVWYEQTLLNSFIEFLKEKGIDAELIHNDVLIEGYKVASAAGINLLPDFKWQYTGMQISINQDLEVIKNACKKPMTKEPKGLSEWGITTDDVEAWVKSL